MPHTPKIPINPNNLSTTRLIERAMARDGVVCRYCGETDTARLTKEHLTPIARGGHRSYIENIGVSCDSCNNEKGNLTDREYKALKDDKDSLLFFQRHLLHLERSAKGRKWVYQPNEVYIDYVSQYTEEEFYEKVRKDYPNPMSATQRRRVREKMMKFRKGVVELKIHLHPMN